MRIRCNDEWIHLFDDGAGPRCGQGSPCNTNVCTSLRATSLPPSPLLPLPASHTTTAVPSAAPHPHRPPTSALAQRAQLSITRERSIKMWTVGTSAESQLCISVSNNMTPHHTWPPPRPFWLPLTRGGRAPNSCYLSRPPPDPAHD